jgi:hypothetical protein
MINACRNVSEYWELRLIHPLDTLGLLSWRNDTLVLQCFILSSVLLSTGRVFSVTHQQLNVYYLSTDTILYWRVTLKNMVKEFDQYTKIMRHFCNHAKHIQLETLKTHFSHPWILWHFVSITVILLQNTVC